MIISLEIVITVIFWTILVPVGVFLQPSDYKHVSVSHILYWVEVHSLPILLLAGEMLLNRVRFISCHVVFPVGVVIGFFIFDLVYALVGGESAYFVVTYGRWWEAFVVVAVFLGTAFAFCFAQWVGEVKEKRRKRKVIFCVQPMCV